jgi:hypothetical protein
VRAIATNPGIPTPPGSSSRYSTGSRSVIVRLTHFLLCALGAAGLFVAYQHFKASGQTALSTGSLIAAALLALVPVRALLREMFEVEGKVLHLVHGLGGLALIALPVSGLVSGTPVLTHAAMAPFALMGAAQAVMHQNNPRNAQQAAALRNFASSLPEVAQFTKSGNLSSPANVSRAIAVLTDLLGKAEALGETELQADPGFQSALRNATTRVGLTLGLDSIDHAVNLLGASQADPAEVQALRRKLAEVRGSLDTNGAHAPPASSQHSGR